MKLNEVFTEWKKNNGVFGIMARLPGVVLPWVADVKSASLDIIYHGAHSGAKEISPLIEAYLVDDAISAEDAQTVVQSVTDCYLHNWSRLYHALELEYNPIENYNLMEKSTDTDKHTGTVGNIENGTNSSENTSSGTSSNTLQHGLKTSVQGSNADNINRSTSGFDSEAMTPESAESSTGTSNSTQTNSGSDVNSGTTSGKNNSSGTTSSNSTQTNDLTDSRQHEMARSGNIGVTTSQQMLISEYELRKRNYFNHIFADIDKLLTLKIY